MESAERRSGASWRYLEAENGLDGLKLAWRELPEVVVADEITSNTGGFAVAKDLKGAAPPFPGAVVIVLARPQDEWLAEWSGADAWLTRPIDPFELADTVVSLVQRNPEPKVAEEA